MPKCFISIWFRHLTTDWLTLKRPALQGVPFVLVTKDRGRLIITATNAIAETQGITTGMTAADAKAMLSELQVIDDIPGQNLKLLAALGNWCIRYTPIIALDPPDGLVLDVSGCTHLWGGERSYLKEIVTCLRSKGYDVRAAMADTVGIAWGIARFGIVSPIIESGDQTSLLSLPPVALRLEPNILDKLHKLGLRSVDSFIRMQRSALRRRFGTGLLLRLDQALGNEDEPLQLLKQAEPYQERLPSLEPIKTAAGIEIAIKRLLETLCQHLSADDKGIRTAVLTCYRIDGKIVKVDIGTNRASNNIPHLYSLFELKIATIEPALGIELFILEAIKVDDVNPIQEKLWANNPGLNDTNVAELLDRIAVKTSATAIRRYLPAERYWPERSIKPALSLKEQSVTNWRTDRPRPTHLLPRPERIEVTAPIPDYPPMLFRYKGKVHQIKKADGPERIEREWWLDKGEHRDYYNVEDEHGSRYWLFRSGHYTGDQSNQWFIHGYFA
ncbi:MAG: protein ImuB [Mucilaginibacter sp.]|nr:protein ImuB [Mucilaginibacter sp.]